eukprot:COSAG01_NODE_1080_length_11819_cov_29.816212_16_plen_58_part_00
MGDCLSLPSWLLCVAPAACLLLLLDGAMGHRRAPKVYPSSTSTAVQGSTIPLLPQRA